MNTRSPSEASATQVLDFWFSAEARPRWFDNTPEFDARLRETFGDLVVAALAGELEHWRETPHGALAMVLLLDQIAYSIHRGTARSYDGRGHALAVAREAVERGNDTGLTAEQRSFLYLPFMHSEDLDDQNRCVTLYAAAGLESNLKFARHHRDIVRRFGRFPHRNAILGRASTPAELDYLASDEAFHG